MTQTQITYGQSGPLPFDSSEPLTAAVVRAGKRGRLKGLVMLYLKNARGGRTDEELTDLIHKLGVQCRWSSIVSARNYLVEHKLVRDSGRTRVSPTSKISVKIWEVTE